MHEQTSPFAVLESRSVVGIRLVHVRPQHINEDVCFAAADYGER